MKRGIIITSALLMSVSGLFAQESVLNTTQSDGCSSKANYEVLTNDFWDNWFVSAGAGGMIYFGDHNKQMDLKNRFSPALDIAVGKWFTPSIGVRLVYSGLQMKGLTKNGSHSTGEIYTDAHDGSHNLYNQKFDFCNVHGDVLFNLMNLFAGYNETRFYSVSPYLGVGWGRVWQSTQRREPTFNLGLYNNFRLSSSLDLNLDVHGMLVKDDFDGEVGGSEEEGSLSATIGLTFKFPNRSWKRCTPANPNLKYTEAEMKGIREKLNAMACENERLSVLQAKSQLADVQNSQVARIDTININTVSPVIVIFPIDKAVLSQDMRVNLSFFAQQLKKTKIKSVFVITGYADNKTGSKQGNELLSRNRAQAVYNCLTREFGISSSQLKLDYKGGVDNMFYNNPALSRATITKAE